MVKNMDKKLAAMRREYGEPPEKYRNRTCRECCNLQFGLNAENHLCRVCIVYGERPELDTEWDKDSAPCGRFYIPFIYDGDDRVPLTERGLDLPKWRQEELSVLIEKSGGDDPKPLR